MRKSMIFFLSMILNFPMWARLQEGQPPTRKDETDYQILRPSKKIIKNKGKTGSSGKNLDAEVSPSAAPVSSPEKASHSGLPVVPKADDGPREPQLTESEALAATFRLLHLPPPFETASVPLATPVSVLLASPNAMLGTLSPFSGKATWIRGEKSSVEPFKANAGGYVILRWPTRDIGNSGPATLLIESDVPVIAVQHWWSDFTIYGSDMPRLLLREAGNWDRSPRKLDLLITGYRFHLFPASLSEGVHNPRVSPLLCPQLRKLSKETLSSLGLDAQDLQRIFPPEAKP